MKMNAVKVEAERKWNRYEDRSTWPIDTLVEDSGGTLEVLSSRSSLNVVPEFLRSAMLFHRTVICNSPCCCQHGR